MTPQAAPPPAPAWHSGWVGRGLLVIGVIFLLEFARPLLLPVAIAVVLTFVLAPAVRWLRRRGLPEIVGAGVLVLSLLGATVLLGSTLVGPATQWWERAPTNVAQLLEQFERLRRAIPLLAPPAAVIPPVRITPPVSSVPAKRNAATAAAASQPAAPPAQAAEQRDPFRDRMASEGVALTGAVLGRALTFGLSAAATVILLYFLLASEHWMLSRTVEAMPRRRTRALLLCGVRSAQREIAHFIAVLGIINVVVGLLTTAAMMWIGLPNPVLWGTVAGVLNFIPYLGPLMIAVLLLLAGTLNFSVPELMLAPAIAFFVIHAIEANLVTPWFVGKRLSLSPVAVFLAVMFWGWLWGIAGAIIAVPLLVGLRSICKRNRRLRLIAVYLEGDSRAPPPSLRSLLRVRRRGVPAAGAGPSR